VYDAVWFITTTRFTLASLIEFINVLGLRRSTYVNNRLLTDWLRIIYASLISPVLVERIVICDSENNNNIRIIK
jgi:hypothetical protein